MYTVGLSTNSSLQSTYVRGARLAAVSPLSCTKVTPESQPSDSGTRPFTPTRDEPISSEQYCSADVVMWDLLLPRTQQLQATIGARSTLSTNAFLM